MVRSGAVEEPRVVTGPTDTARVPDSRGRGCDHPFPPHVVCPPVPVVSRTGVGTRTIIGRHRRGLIRPTGTRQQRGGTAKRAQAVGAVRPPRRRRSTPTVTSIYHAVAMSSRGEELDPTLDHAIRKPIAWPRQFLAASGVGVCRIARRAIRPVPLRPYQPRSRRKGVAPSLCDRSTSPPGNPSAPCPGNLWGRRGPRHAARTHAADPTPPSPPESQRRSVRGRRPSAANATDCGWSATSLILHIWIFTGLPVLGEPRRLIRAHDHSRKSGRWISRTPVQGQIPA